MVIPNGAKQFRPPGKWSGLKKMTGHIIHRAGAGGAASGGRKGKGKEKETKKKKASGTGPSGAERKTENGGKKTKTALERRGGGKNKQNKNKNKLSSQCLFIEVVLIHCPPRLAVFSLTGWSHGPLYNRALVFTAKGD